MQNRTAFIWRCFPKFLLGFALLSGWVSLDALTGPQIESLTSLSRWFCLLAFAGVGLRSQLSRMKAGYRPILVGLGVETAVAATTFLLLSVVL